MFNQNLKELRSKQGITQKQLAEHLKISPQSVSKWEKGEALPSIDFLPKLAECLNCDINALFISHPESTYNIELLKEFFALMTEYLCEEKNPTDFFPFWTQHPDILEIIRKFGEDLKQHKTVKSQTIQKLLNCTDEEVSLFIEHFTKQELLEKIESNDLYYVLQDNIDGLILVVAALNQVCELMAK